MLHATAPTLTAEFERYVDERLDAVERVLLAGQVSRSERATILEELELQIQERLAELNEPVTRESILRVLASLDPPEAYLDPDRLPQWSRSERRSKTPLSQPTKQSKPTPNESVPQNS